MTWACWSLSALCCPIAPHPETSNEDFLMQKPTIDVANCLINAVALSGKTDRGEGGEVDSFSWQKKMLVEWRLKVKIIKASAVRNQPKDEITHPDEAALCRWLCQLWCSLHGQRYRPLVFASCKRTAGEEKAFTAPFWLWLFAPVMKSKHNGEGLCSYKIVIFVEAVGCSDHPRASNLIENQIWGTTVKTYQGATALGVDVVLTFVLVPDQSCYPGVGIFLLKYL